MGVGYKEQEESEGSGPGGNTTDVRGGGKKGEG